MKIGIIGSTLTRRLMDLGHDVRVANSRDPDTLGELAEETGATPVWAEDAVDDVELVVVTIPEKTVTELPDDLFADVPDDVVVVDTGNYYPRERDGRIEPIEEGLPESRWVERQIGRPVIKAFNNIYFENLMNKGRPADSPDRGDDARAKAVVLELIEELGFDGVDAVGLDDRLKTAIPMLAPFRLFQFDSPRKPANHTWHTKLEGEDDEDWRRQHELSHARGGGRDS